MVAATVAASAEGNDDTQTIWIQLLGQQQHRQSALGDGSTAHCGSTSGWQGFSGAFPRHGDSMACNQKPALSLPETGLFTEPGGRETCVHRNSMAGCEAARPKIRSKWGMKPHLPSSPCARRHKHDTLPPHSCESDSTCPASCLPRWECPEGRSYGGCDS